MTFEEIYTTMKNYFENKDFSGFGAGTYSYEFDITGEGEGKFYIEVNDGTMEMQPFDYKNSLFAFEVSSGSLCSIIERRMSPAAAYSTGRLLIKGDVSAAFRLADALALTL